RPHAGHEAPAGAGGRAPGTAGRGDPRRRARAVGGGAIAPTAATGGGGAPVRVRPHVLRGRAGPRMLRGGGAGQRVRGQAEATDDGEGVGGRMSELKVLRN